MRLNRAGVRTRALAFLGPVLGLILVVAGCFPGGPTIRGWSGVMPSGPTQPNQLFVGSMDGRIYSLSPTARAQGVTFPAQGEWVYPPLDKPALKGPVRAAGFGCAPTPTGVGIYGNPAIATVGAGKTTFVIVTSDVGKVYAINAANGAYRWEYPHELDQTIGPIISSPVVSDSTLYVASADGNLYALDTETGDRKWQFPTNGRIWTTPAISGGAVYVGNFEGSGYGVAAADGKQLWKVDLGAAIASVAADGGLVLFGTFDNQLHAHDARTGDRLWKFDGGNWFWAPPVLSGETVYASSLDHSVYAINSKTGAQLWKFNAGSPVDAPPVIRGESLFVLTQSGNLHVISARDGSLTKTVNVGTETLAPPSASDGMVYVHGRDQRVYAVNVTAGNVVWKQPLTP